MPINAGIKKLITALIIAFVEFISVYLIADIMLIKYYSLSSMLRSCIVPKVEKPR